MQQNGKNYMETSVARTEWKLAKILQASRSPLEADAAVMEKRSLGYLENTSGLNGLLLQGDDQIEEAFDNLVFFWSR